MMKLEAIKNLWQKRWFKIVIIVIACLMVVAIGAFTAHLSEKRHAQIPSNQSTELAVISAEEIEERQLALSLEKIERDMMLANLRQDAVSSYERLNLKEVQTQAAELSPIEKVKLADDLRNHGREILTVDPVAAKLAYEQAHELAPKESDVEFIKLISGMMPNTKAS